MRATILPVTIVYTAAIALGLIVPVVAVGLYCALAIALVVRFKEIGRLLFR